MSTINASQVIEILQVVIAKHGDVPVALWDIDSGRYYCLTPANFELQLMPDDSLRLSVGVNNFDDPGEEEPKNRPIPITTPNAN